MKGAVEAGYAGWECLAGIPGTVGGTPVQNVGAYGQEVLRPSSGFGPSMGRRGSLSSSPMQSAGLRIGSSRFNSVRPGTVHCDARGLQAAAGWAPQITYADLKVTSAIRQDGDADACKKWRRRCAGFGRRKGMLLVEGDPDCRSAGSFFKNPAVDADVAERARNIARGCRCGAAGLSECGRDGEDSGGVAD